MSKSRQVPRSSIPGAAAPAEMAREPINGLSWRVLAAAALLVVLVFASYAPAFRGVLIWDDDVNLTTNATLRDPDGWRRMWLDPRSTQQYYPLTYTSHRIEYQLWGLDPLGYHLVNVALHCAAAMALWRLLVVLGVPCGWLAAALFALHPVQVESVAWITERKNVLSMLLGLLSILSYLRFAPLRSKWSSKEAAIPAEANRRWLSYAASLALFAAALFSKTAVVPLPAVILVLVWWQRGRIAAADVIPLLPFFALACALGVITVQMERAEGAAWNLSLAERPLLAGRALWFYIGKLIWPAPLVFLYPRFVIDGAAWTQYLAPLAAVSLLVALWLARHRLGRGPLAAMLLFAGILAPVLGFLTIHYTRYAYVADHFQYHASAALIALVVAGGAALATYRPSYRTVLTVLAGCALAVCCVLTSRRAQVYRGPEVLFRDTIAGNPACWIAYANLGGYLETQGRYEEAVELARAAVRVDPAAAGGHNNLASALLSLGRRDGFPPGALTEAHDELQAALRLNPTLADAHVNMAFALLTMGKANEAHRHAAAAVELSPQHPQAHYALGTILAAQGDPAQAEAHYRSAIAANPRLAGPYYGLGVQLAARQELVEAALCLHTALDLDPTLAEAHYALGGIAAQRQDLPEAAREFSAAVALRKTYPRALNNLGVIQMNQGKTAEAIASFEAAVRQDPGYQEARNNLERAREVRAAP